MAFDVIVVGLGAMGAATAWQLARAALMLGGYRLGVLDMEGALRSALAGAGIRRGAGRRRQRG